MTFFEDTHDTRDDLTPHVFNVDTDLKKGLTVLAKNAPELLARLLNSDEDPLDGPAAETVLQWVILGEHRYG